jgi:hypothetical protein
VTKEEWSPPGSGKDAAMMIEEQAIRKAVDFWNNGDLEGYLRLYDSYRR